jgi:hypothetical protein
MLKSFETYIGIDYSGAEATTSRIAGLQVYRATQGSQPVRIATPAQPPGQRWKWTRKEIAHWLAKQLAGEPAIVGIDHAFSFPVAYLDRHRLTDWDQFLDDFCKHWPTYEDFGFVDRYREGNRRSGTKADGLRLTEKWTSSAKCVFQFDCQGTVAKSSHAGIPWLHFLRHRPELAGKLHFWPFDGFDVPPGRSVVAEVYPSIFRNRYPRDDRNGDQQDAYATARWLREMDERQALVRYFHPSLSADDRQLARREGWILGVA